MNATLCFALMGTLQLQLLYPDRPSARRLFRSRIINDGASLRPSGFLHKSRSRPACGRSVEGEAGRSSGVGRLGSGPSAGAHVPGPARCLQAQVGACFYAGRGENDDASDSPQRACGDGGYCGSRTPIQDQLQTPEDGGYALCEHPFRTICTWDETKSGGKVFKSLVNK